MYLLDFRANKFRIYMQTYVRILVTSKLITITALFPIPIVGLKLVTLYVDM